LWKVAGRHWWADSDAQMLPLILLPLYHLLVYFSFLPPYTFLNWHIVIIHI
jgi:hypothetical protein